MDIAHVTRRAFTTDRRRALTSLIAGVAAPLFAFSPRAGAKSV